jgi:hypothetical protein
MSHPLRISVRAAWRGCLAQNKCSSWLGSSTIFETEPLPNHDGACRRPWRVAGRFSETLFRLRMAGIYVVIAWSSTAALANIMRKVGTTRLDVREPPQILLFSWHTLKSICCAFPLR